LNNDNDRNRNDTNTARSMRVTPTITREREHNNGNGLRIGVSSGEGRVVFLASWTSTKSASRNVGLAEAGIPPCGRPLARACSCLSLRGRPHDPGAGTGERMNETSILHNTPPTAFQPRRLHLRILSNDQNNIEHHVKGRHN
jgi:hypothetical protein